MFAANKGGYICCWFLQCVVKAKCSSREAFCLVYTRLICPRANGANGKTTCTEEALGGAPHTASSPSLAPAATVAYLCRPLCLLSWQCPPPSQQAAGVKRWLPMPPRCHQSPLWQVACGEGGEQKPALSSSSIWWTVVESSNSASTPCLPDATAH